MKHAAGAIVEWANSAKRAKEAYKLDRVATSLLGVLRGSATEAGEAEGPVAVGGA